MRTKILLLFALCVAFSSCKKWLEESTVQIQKPYQYDEQYYKNLRDFKSRPHEISYGWFAGYANAEGLEDEPYKQSASWGEHFLGLPDSLDICSCWGGVPTREKNPIAYDEMRYVRKVKGTKMLNVTICRIAKRTGPPDGQPKYSSTANMEDVIAYAAELVAECMVKDENGEQYVDGLDLDFEPAGDWLVGNWFVEFVKEIGKSIGPMAETEAGRKMLLVVDFYNQSPPSGVEPYVNYFIRQAYTQGFSEHSDSRLQSGYDGIASWCPVSKYVVTENYGEFWATGGSPYLNASGGPMLRPDGKRMYSIEGMARWRPNQGKKGGWGAFYIHRDYQNPTGYPYIREAIQLANPAMK